MKLSRLPLPLLLLLAALFLSDVQSQQAPTPVDQEKQDDPFQERWVWCVEDKEDLELCKSMNSILDNIDPDKEHQHSCIYGEGDSEACMKKIATGEAKIGIFDGGEILQANEQYGLLPIRTEDNQVDTSSYYGVGIVRANECPARLSDLRGKRSCHTGYGRSAGWVLPVTYLIENKIMPVVNSDPQVSNDVESVKAFFSKSCATSNNPRKSICSACKVTTNCTEDDEYDDYAGAFRCLVEGSGDIAFTKHTIPSLYAKGGTLAANWNNLADTSGYKIVCPNSFGGQSCADVSSFKACNFGKAPGHTIMVSGNFSEHEIDEFNAVMDKANNNPAFKDLFSGENLLANEFAAGASASVQYNGSAVTLLGDLYERTLELRRINEAGQTTPASRASLTSPSTSVLILSIVYMFARHFLM